MLRKEWLQMRRDLLTVALTVDAAADAAVPVRLCDQHQPRHLPTGLLSAEHSKYERTLIAALQNTGYYRHHAAGDEPKARRRWRAAMCCSCSTFRPTSRAGSTAAKGRGPDGCGCHRSDGDRQCDRGAGGLNATVLNRDLPPSMQVQPSQPPFQIVLHARYNPEQLTVLNIVPGLIGVDPDRSRRWS